MAQNAVHFYVLEKILESLHEDWDILCEIQAKRELIKRPLIVHTVH